MGAGVHTVVVAVAASPKAKRHSFKRLTTRQAGVWRACGDLCEHLGRCSVPSAYSTSAGSAEPLTSQPGELMRRGLQGDPGKLDLKTFRPESGRWETRESAGPVRGGDEVELQPPQ